MGGVKSLFWFGLGKLVVTLVQGLVASCRIEEEGREAVDKLLRGRRYIFASWHGRLILFFTSCRKNGGDAVMTSRSRDGSFAAQLQICGGCRVFRGSTGKGGRDALEEMGAYMLTQGKPAMLSVDGPTGPIYRVKPGAVRLASRTGFPIIPITFSAHRAKIFGSWDRCMIPKPFSRATIIYGRPIHVPPDIQSEEVACYVNQVEIQLRGITRRADERNGRSGAGLCDGGQ